MLKQIDQQLFLIINRIWTNDFFDFIMPLMRSKLFWAPLYLFLIVFFVVNFGKKGWISVLFILITFALTDFISAGVFKPIFERLRPCNDPNIMGMARNIVGCGSGYSFVSSHAANHFGMAIIIGSIFKQKWPWVKSAFIIWATVICYAQVYVGVHYPLDVICGAIIGILIGKFTFALHEKFNSLKNVQH
jgi:undecaprenyl-diphosphatase